MANKEKLYRIAELERLSGLPRRTIHFYVQSGLLHQPLKTGKTMAYYDDEHLQELKLIMKEKAQGAPLFAIKKGLNDKDAQGEHNVSFKIKLGNPKKMPQKRAKITKHRTNRDNIISQGCDFFRKKGFKQTKVSDITKELNIGKGTFYFYFSDKKELLLECVPTLFKDFFSQGWDKIRKEKNPQKRLELRAQSVFPVLSEFCAIVQLCKEAMEDADSKLKRMGWETFLSIRKPIEADIEKGIALGDFRAFDPKIIATIMIGIIESMYYLKDLDQSMAHEAIWNNIIQLLMSGIKK